jgi:hypothetical protein
MGKKSFERVEQFRYLGTTLTNQNHLKGWNSSDIWGQPQQTKIPFMKKNYKQELFAVTVIVWV